MRTSTRAAGALLALGLGAAASGCGSADKQEAAPSPVAKTSAPSKPAADLTGQAWLLRFNTSGGSEGETTHAVYVHFTPSTGATVVHQLPGIGAPDTYSGSQALMVSADQKYALLDSAVTPADRKHGRLSLYPTLPGKRVFLDLRAITGVKNLKPVGAAFDPAEAEVLHVVDSARRVWVVDADAKTAKRTGVLVRRSGWIFANTFDKNTGEPFIADINSSATEPAGNGDDDVRPVERRGGTIWVDIGDGSGAPQVKPAPPCGFGGGFVDADGTRWLFCADTPRITAYELGKDDESWTKVGTASTKKLPANVEELPVVLPPV